MPTGKDDWAYAAVVSINAKQTLQYHAEEVAQKVIEREAFDLLDNLTCDQFQAGTVDFKDAAGKPQTWSVDKIINTCISAIGGADKPLGHAFKQEVDNLKRALTKLWDPESIIDIKIRLSEAWTAALLNDVNIDQTELRHSYHIYFDMIGMINTKGDIYNEQILDDTIKALQEEKDRMRVNATPQTEEKGKK
jgi:hypothetical protein